MVPHITFECPFGYYDSYPVSAGGNMGGSTKMAGVLGFCVVLSPKLQPGQVQATGGYLGSKPMDTKHIVLALPLG